MSADHRQIWSIKQSLAAASEQTSADVRSLSLQMERVLEIVATRTTVLPEPAGNSTTGLGASPQTAKRMWERAVRCTRAVAKFAAEF